jgi:glycosyltransferase involved in cell wall biosynthesis
MGIINRAANVAVEFANRLAANFADRVIAYTEDFAIHSPFLSRYQSKLQVIPPPVEVEVSNSKQVERFIQERRKLSGPVIGMASRLATEKGVEYLLEALDRILEHHPEVEVLFAGQYQDVLGEEAYAEQLAPMLEKHQRHWNFLGVLDPNEMASFFQVCDVTVLPSVNSTESFGLVQIESMMCGTPVVASNLPGVRQPVRTTGMGEVVPLRDPIALADAILSVLGKSEDYQTDVNQLEQRFSPARVAAEYEALFENLLAIKRK